MINNDFISVNLLLSDILVQCNDEQLRRGLTKGFYTSMIQSALEELAFTTFFEKITVDLPLDKTNLQLEMPENLFNIRELYLWNGNCCTPQSSVPVHWKRLFNNMPGGTSYTSKIHENTTDDPMYGTFYNGFPSTVRFANIQNGIIMFSSSCAGYDNVRIVGNGTAGAIGDEPVIPRFFRQAIIDFCCEKFYRIIMAREKGFVSMWQIYDNRLKDSWFEAERRVKNLNTWQRDELHEHLSKKW